MSNPSKAEADRIRAEFERRDGARQQDERYALTAVDVLLRVQERERETLLALQRQGLLPLRGRQILDIGCGLGDWLDFCLRMGADRQDLHGVDLSQARVDHARARTGADVRCADATRLPWSDQTFDIVHQSTVFSSILDDQMSRSIAGEMIRVLAPKGRIIWYDFFVNNPSNAAVRGVPMTKLRKLFPGFKVHSKRITLAAPLARKIAPRAPWLAQLLTSTRILNLHHLAVLQKP